MANRHLSRSIVLQTLFEWDFGGKPETDAPEMLERNTAEFGPGLDDDTFMKELLSLVLKKRPVIDGIIEKAAPEWPIDKISAVDRNVLRLGLTELLFGDRTQVPPKVAINEAIEIAKSFGGENSGKFVNGVLGAVYKEIGEPGKDEVGKKKAPKEPVDPKTLPLELLVGAIVYAETPEGIQMALVHDLFGYWTLSKGKVEPGEEEPAAVIRKVKDEIGLDCVPKDKLGESEYVASHPEKGRLRKRVSYFLAEAPFGPLTLKTGGGLDDAKWFALADIAGLTMYDDIVPMFEKAIAIIMKK